MSGQLFFVPIIIIEFKNFRVRSTFAGLQPIDLSNFQRHFFDSQPNT